MERRRFVTTTALGTAGGLLGRGGTGEATGSSQAGPATRVEEPRPGEKASAPVADVMRREHEARSGIALGGLGTGSAELRKDGRFHNWTCFNNEPQFTGPRLSWPQDSILFFVVRYQLPGREPRLKLLQIEGERHEQGAVPMALYEFPWLSGVDGVAYRARFPFAWLAYDDGDMPLEIELQAMSPFVPHDVDDSSLPAMILDFHVRSKAHEPVDVMLMATLRNVAGYDTADKLHAARLDRQPGAVLCTMTATGMDPQSSSLGTTTLASLSEDTSSYLGWEHRHPYYERVLREPRLPDVDDTDGRNPVDRQTGKKRAMERLWSTLGRSARLEPGGAIDHGFVVAWHFPNLWSERRTHVEGHLYSGRFADSAAVAAHVVETRGDLVDRSRAFLEAFYDSTAPAYVLDQVNSQLNTFATSSWLTRSGDFGILEGMAPDQSWGPIATMDVSMYGSVAVAALFPDLQKSSMRAHRRLQADSGEMAHGIEKDFQRPKLGVAGVHRRLDLHAQYAFMVLRDFFWTGDEAYLRDMWPSVRKALDYVLRERDLDGDSLRAALRSVLEMSYRPAFGLRNCSWPGDAPWHDVPADTWVDQANTCWSGVELAFASFLVYEGLVEEGLAVLRTVDDRYRRVGRYFDHQEFGGHYFRPMAAWAMLHALLGLTIREGRFSFAPKPSGDVRLFFSHGAGTATYSHAVAGGRETIAIDVRSGVFSWRQLGLATRGPGARRVQVSLGGRPLALPAREIDWDGSRLAVRPAAPGVVPAGSRLEIAIES